MAEGNRRQVPDPKSLRGDYDDREWTEYQVNVWKMERLVQ